MWFGMSLGLPPIWQAPPVLTCALGKQCQKTFNFQGGVATADFKMGLDFYKRDVFLQQKFLEIRSINKVEGREHKDFDTPFSGYLGIAPWTANPAEKEQNFLW